MIPSYGKSLSPLQVLANKLMQFLFLHEAIALSVRDAFSTHRD